MQAYRIINWKGKFEVTDKGKAYSPGSADMLKKKPLEYLRMPVSGHKLSPEWRRIVKNAWRPNDIFECSVKGVYDLLLEIVADQPARFRGGWILDTDGNPMNDTQIAELLDIQNIPIFKQAMTALTSSSIGLVALCEVGEVNQLPAAARGEGADRGSGTLWGVSPKFQTFQKFPDNNRTKPNITELNQTKPNQRDPQQGGELPRDPQGNGGFPPDKRRQTHETIRQILKVETPASQKVLIGIMDTLEGKVITGRAKEGIYDLAVAEAKQCTTAENPIGLFVYKMKKSPFSYDPDRMLLKVPG